MNIDYRDTITSNLEDNTMTSAMTLDLDSMMVKALFIRYTSLEGHHMGSSISSRLLLLTYLYLANTAQTPNQHLKPRYL